MSCYAIGTKLNEKAMNVKNFIKKIIHLPAREEQNLEAVELWAVRWRSRHGEGYYDYRPVMEVFTNRVDAEVFARELREAQKLLRYTENLRIEVTKE